MKEEIKGERGRKETREGGMGSGREGGYKLTPCDTDKMKIKSYTLSTTMVE